jgi:hypothetical protein
VRVIAAATFLLILAASCLQAQAPPITSSLPNAGAAVGVLLNSPYGPINFTPVVAGKFSSATQSNGDDLVTVTFGTAPAGQFSCMRNLGAGQFSQPILSQTITWPIAAVQLLNFGTPSSPATDSIAVANSTGVSIYSFTNCVATLTSLLGISNVSSISGLIAGTEQFLISCSNGLAIEDVTLSSFACLPFPASSIVVTGALPAPYQFVGIEIVPSDTQPSSNAQIVLGYVGTGGTLVSTNLAPLSGDAFLGCVFSSTVVCFSSTESNIFVQPLIASGLDNSPPNLDFSVSQNLSLAEVPVAFVSGNIFSANDNGSDIEFAGSDSIYQYVEDAGAATWTLQNTLLAPPDSAITGFTAGSVIPGENDAIAESGLVTPNETNTDNEYAIVWASTALSEQATSPPVFTSAATIQFTEMQAGTFTVTASGTPTPTISETGFLPSGISFNPTTGVLSGTPAQGTAGTYDEIVFTAANGVGTPATQSFTLFIKSDAPPLVGFNVTNENPSDGSFTQLPAEGPQQGCPNPAGGCYPEGTVVTLTATPNAGFVFSTWMGFTGCGTNPVCVVTMGSQAVVLTLSFTTAAPTITVTPPSQSGQPGGTFTYTVASSSSQLTVSCATIPAATCSVSKGVVSVQTTAPSGSNVLGMRWLLPLGLCGLALICVPRRTRRTALCVTALTLCGACGGGSGSKLVVVTGTPAGTYTVAVTATTGSAQTTSNVQLVIQ